MILPQNPWIPKTLSEPVAIAPKISPQPPTVLAGCPLLISPRQPLESSLQPPRSHLSRVNSKPRTTATQKANISTQTQTQTMTTLSIYPSKVATPLSSPPPAQTHLPAPTRVSFRHHPFKKRNHSTAQTNISLYVITSSASATTSLPSAWPASATRTPTPSSQPCFPRPNHFPQNTIPTALRPLHSGPVFAVRSRGLTPAKERSYWMTTRSYQTLAFPPRALFSCRRQSSTNQPSGRCHCALNRHTAQGTTPSARARAGRLREVWKATKRQIRRKARGLVTKSLGCRNF